MHMATAPSHAANLTSFSLYIKLQKEGVADFNPGYSNTHSHREDKPADRPVEWRKIHKNLFSYYYCLITRI